MMKTIHTLTITLRFDRKCTKATAIAMAKDNIHGNFYPYQHTDSHPSEFWVKSFKA